MQMHQHDKLISTLCQYAKHSHDWLGDGSGHRMLKQENINRKEREREGDRSTQIEACLLLCRCRRYLCTIEHFISVNDKGDNNQHKHTRTRTRLTSKRTVRMQSVRKRDTEWEGMRRT